MKFQDISLLKKHYPLVTGAQKDILHTVCPPVIEITNKVRNLGRALLKLVHEYDGVGLAAPQVGRTTRMAVVTQWNTSKKKRKLLNEFVMINPKVLYASDETNIDNEGCLSLPGIQGKVQRPTHITLQYTDLKDKTHIIKANGFNARVILHELDHLDGVLFTEKTV